MGMILGGWESIVSEVRMGLPCIVLPHLLFVCCSLPIIIIIIIDRYSSYYFSPSSLDLLTLSLSPFTVSPLCIEKETLYTSEGPFAADGRRHKS